MAGGIRIEIPNHCSYLGQKLIGSPLKISLVVLKEAWKSDTTIDQNIVLILARN